MKCVGTGQVSGSSYVLPCFRAKRTHFFGLNARRKPRQKCTGQARHWTPTRESIDRGKIPRLETKSWRGFGQRANKQALKISSGRDKSRSQESSNSSPRASSGVTNSKGLRGSLPNAMPRPRWTLPELHNHIIGRPKHSQDAWQASQSATPTTRLATRPG